MQNPEARPVVISPPRALACMHSAVLLPPQPKRCVMRFLCAVRGLCLRSEDNPECECLVPTFTGDALLQRHLPQRPFRLAEL